MPGLKALYDGMIENMGVPDLEIPFTAVKFYRGEEVVPEAVLKHQPADISLTSCQAAKQAALGDMLCLTRENIGYKKDHWIDAVCVGETGETVSIPRMVKPLLIKAMGRGSRQMCRVDQFGFPRTKAKSIKTVKGFQTGDLVKSVVTKGKKIGTYVGRVAVRKSGSFNIKTSVETVQGISWKYCKLIQNTDGYLYS